MKKSMLIVMAIAILTGCNSTQKSEPSSSTGKKGSLVGICEFTPTFSDFLASRGAAFVVTIDGKEIARVKNGENFSYDQININNATVKIELTLENEEVPAESVNTLMSIKGCVKIKSNDGNKSYCLIDETYGGSGVKPENFSSYIERLKKRMTFNYKFENETITKID